MPAFNFGKHVHEFGGGEIYRFLAIVSLKTLAVIPPFILEVDTQKVAAVCYISPSIDRSSIFTEANCLLVRYRPTSAI